MEWVGWNWDNLQSDFDGRIDILGIGTLRHIPDQGIDESDQDNWSFQSGAGLVWRVSLEIVEILDIQKFVWNSIRMR